MPAPYDDRYQLPSWPPTTFNIVLWNLIFGDIADRLAAREELEASFEALIAEGTQASLDYIQATIAPQIASLQDTITLAQDQIDQIVNDGIAPDSSKLGGQLPAYYATAAALTAGLGGKVSTSLTINGKPLTANVTLDKSDVGLGDVENLPPADMPVSTAQAAALADKLGGTVRNTVLHGDNANGAPSFLTTGSGLTPAFTATNPLVMTFADGFNANGAKDVLARLTAGASLVAIAASCISYLAATYVDGSNVTWSATKAPPQYGATYNRAAQSCLKLASNALDDFGNAWTNNGVTFDGTTGTFNGSTSYLVSTALTTLYPPNSNGGFTIRAKVKPSSLASEKFIASLQVSGGYGAFTLSVNTSGKVTLRAGSTGSAWDVASATVGAATLSTGTEYLVELTYDPVAAKYYIYVNGVLDQTVNSSTKLYAANAYMLVGCTNNAGTVPASIWSGTIRGFEFLPYCDHPAGTTYSVPASPPDITAAGYASDWFDTIAQQMKSVSAASGASGSNPTFTTSKKVYVGEAQAGASSISSVTAYAFNQTGKNGAGLLNAFGYGQTTKNTASGEISRTAGVKYYNTSPKPIEVCIRLDAGSGGGYMSLNVNDKLKASAYAYAGYSIATATVIVPPGGNYAFYATFSISGAFVSETN